MEEKVPRAERRSRRKPAPFMVIHILSGLVVVVSATLFIGFTLLVFTKPAAAERFLMGFASSARTHFAEQIFRVLLGGSLVVYSTAMWQADVFWLIGWAIVVSSVGLMLIPWQWHHRFGKKLLPIMIQHIRLYAICPFAFGAVLLYAAFAARILLVVTWMLTIALFTYSFVGKT